MLTQYESRRRGSAIMRMCYLSLDMALLYHTPYPYGNTPISFRGKQWLQFSGDFEANTSKRNVLGETRAVDFQ